MTEVVNVVAAAAGIVAAVWWVRGRVWLAVAAAAGGVFALLGPLDGLAERSLAAHMGQHVLVGDLAPLLLVLALVGADLGRIPLAARLAPAARRVCRPAPAFVLWAAALAVWHVPAVYAAALENERLHAFEHACFAVGGLLVWLQLLDPARRGLLRGWWRFGYAVALLVAAQMLANVLVLSYRPLYGVYAAGDIPFGLSPVADQNGAAVVMMTEQLLTVGTFAFVVARRLIARTPARAPGHHPLAT